MGKGRGSETSSSQQMHGDRAGDQLEAGSKLTAEAVLAPMFCGAASGYSKTREPQAERRREQAAHRSFCNRRRQG
jgi:hypothetical protein